MEELQEYIKKEFGIIPDETQIEEIKKIVADYFIKGLKKQLAKKSPNINFIELIKIKE